MRYIILVGIFIFLTGCAAVSLENSKQDSIKNLGLVVLVDNKISASYIGFTIFNNFSVSIPDDSGKYENIVAAEATEYLENKGYNVTSMPVESALREDFNKLGASEIFKSKVADKSKSLNINAFALIYDSARCVVVSDSGPTKGRAMPVSGYGLTAAVATPVYAYACLGLDIVDMKSRDTIVKTESAKYKSIYKKALLWRIKDKKDELDRDEIVELYKHIDNLFPETLRNLLEVANF